MNLLCYSIVALILESFGVTCGFGNCPADTAIPPVSPRATDTASGWIKYAGNPVLGGTLGTCFDVSVMQVGDRYRMWFSWRPRKSVALVESQDGLQWSEPKIVLGPRTETGWEEDINRPVVIKRDDGYHAWYTGQAKGQSWIGYATSLDGINWERASRMPALSPEQPWEKVAVMCPHVIWDKSAGLFRMWYSGGEQYEPDAIGYAVSPDGVNWTKHWDNPIFKSDPQLAWESHKVTGCQVVRLKDWHVMFYIGFRDRDHAQIGIACSRDGITAWKRHLANPIIRPTLNGWDHDACYKPFALVDDGKWRLWYNGRHGSLEQIGVAFHEGEDLGFVDAQTGAPKFMAPGRIEQ
jgi:beta-1,2-mannobiose phosphorylase / 1,2-beta-oligomannan phosphorylase